MTGQGPLQNDRIREHNRFLVYASLKHQGKLSRTDISRATDLSIPTVTTIIHEFIQLGLVDEVGQSTPRGGRPAQLISFNPQAYTVLSVDLAQQHYQAAIIDLLGNPVRRFTGPRRRRNGEQELISWLADLHAQHSASYRIQQTGVSVPGVVDPDTGNVHLASALGWDNFPLAQHLEQTFGHRVILENDVNALAIGELHYGQGSDCTNVAYLSVTDGIGFAIVINRQIYRGSHSAAGEIGYSTLKDISPQPSPVFGQPGPLENHLFQLEEAFLTDAGIDLTSPHARNAFTHFCDDLTMILQNALCLLNPERLVVSWPRDTQHLLCQHLQTSLRTPAPVNVVSAALEAEGALLGVARLTLDVLEEQLCSSQRQEVIDNV